MYMAPIPPYSALLKLLEYLIHAETSTILSLAMDDVREVGDGEDDVVGCGELDLVVLSWLRLP